MSGLSLEPVGKVQRSEREDLRSGYLGRFVDASPAGWDVVERDGGWWVRLPNGQSVELGVGASGPPWTGDLEPDPTSTRLWLNSLRFLPSLIDRAGPQAGVAVLSSFMAFLTNAAQRPESVASGSLDHQIALRLRTACDIVSMEHTALDDGHHWVSLRSLACEMVRLDLNIVERLGLLRPNNHGIMLGIGIIHASDLFRWTSRDAWLNHTVQFLEQSFRSIFGEVGVANENTPIYQSLYVGLLRQLVDYVEWTRSGDADTWAELLEPVELAYRKMLLPDGSCPPLGDGCRGGQSVYQPVAGLLAAPADGLFVWSNADIYLAAIAGQRGVFHKQMDDTSFYLNVAGHDLICDGGLGSYAKGDAIAQSVRSQRGHSGLFFEEFDGVDPTQVISWGTGQRAIVGALTVLPGTSLDRPGVQLMASYAGTRTERRLGWLSERVLEIVDRARSSGDHRRAVRRFLTHPDATTTVVGRHVLVENRTSSLVLCLDPQDSVVRVFRGHAPEAGQTSEPLPKGFLAVRNYDVRPAALVEVPTWVGKSGEVERRTLVTIADGDETGVCAECGPVITRTAKFRVGQDRPAAPRMPPIPGH